MGSNEHTDLPKNGGCIGDFYWGYGISIGAEKHVRKSCGYNDWLVVSTPLKNMIQLG